jgi:DivIVA domain-containing protein
MASSEMRDNDSNRAMEGVRPDTETEAAELGGASAKEDRPTRRFSARRVIAAAERAQMLEEARSIEFPTGLRGYERAAVDRYVERVNRIIAELERSSSPESAVSHALDEVSEETSDILQRAHQTADEITARSRAKADDRLQQAELEAEEMLGAAQQEAKDTREAAHQEAQETREAAQHEAQELREMTASEAQNLRELAQREAAELRETTIREMNEFREANVREAHQLRDEADEMRESARREAGEMLERAETRARELARNAEAVWRERRRVIDDMRAVEEQLAAILEVEDKRFPRLAEDLPLSDEPTREQTSTPVGEPGALPHQATKTE